MQREANVPSWANLSLPRVIIWDVDGTVWAPEMYELWGGGGSPFRSHGDAVLDRRGEAVSVLGDAREILWHLRSRDVRVAIASTCDEPAWAAEVLSKMPGHESEANALASYFHADMREVYKARDKSTHLKAIARKSGCRLDEMLFFDNQRDNVHCATRLGVLAVLTPTGVTHQIFHDALLSYSRRGRDSIA